MTLPREILLTLEDLYNLPDDQRRYELSQGRLVSEPPPGFRHGRVLSEIDTALNVYAKRHRLGVVIAGDAGFVLARKPATVRAPDVAFVTAERFLALAEDTGPMHGPPDLAVEVLSPGDRPGRVAAKVSDYIAAGTRAVWLINPQKRTAHVHRPDKESVELAAADWLTDEDLLPGFRVRIGDLFRTCL